jgi:hypothetical protein
MHAPSTTSDPTACSHPYAGARSCAHSDHIAPAQIDAPAHRCPAAPTHEILLRRLDQQHEQRLRQRRRHDLRLVRRSGRAWMHVGGVVWVGGGWWLQRVCVSARGCARGGLAVGRPPPRRGARAAQNVSAAASRGTLSPAEDAAPPGKLGDKGQDTARAPEPRVAGTVPLPSSVCAHENAISTSPPRPRQARQAATGACFRRHERRRQPQGGR